MNFEVHRHCLSSHNRLEYVIEIVLDSNFLVEDDSFLFLRDLFNFVVIGLEVIGDFEEHLLHNICIDKIFIEHSIKFCGVGLRYILDINHSFKTIDSCLFVVFFVLIEIECSRNGFFEVILIVLYENKTGSLFSFWVVIMDCVLQSPRSGCHNWSGSNKEFMLHYTARLKLRGHHSKIASDVNDRTIYG